MTTTLKASPWSIVDQIIRVEIPNAVPGCEGLKNIPEIVSDKTAWKAVYEVTWAMYFADNQAIIDERPAIRDLLPRLNRQAMEMLADAGRWFGASGGDMADAVRTTLAEIKGA